MGIITKFSDFLLLMENSEYKITTDFSDFSFNEELLGYHHDQSDVIMTMTHKDDNKILAKCDYIIFQGVVNISYIKSIVTGKGYGAILIEKIASLYGYPNIDWGMTTPEGSILKSKLDKKYNFDKRKYLESKCDHIEKEEISKIKNPIIKSFIEDMINIGSEDTWKKWTERIITDVTIKNYDFNELEQISEWVKTSKTNLNQLDDSPPDWVRIELEKLK